MSEAIVTSLGRCPGCLKMGKLHGGCCGACAKFGPNFGALAKRIREEPAFKAMCYGRLTSAFTRSEFVQMFGPLEQAG